MPLSPDARTAELPARFRTTLKNALKNALLDACAVLVPVDCVGCGADDRVFCAECAAQLQARVRSSRLADGTPVSSALEYRGVVRQAVLEFKEHGRTDAAGLLSRPLGLAIDTALAGGNDPPYPVSQPGRPIELVLVPASRRAYRRRGYDPVALLVHRVGYRSDPGVFLPMAAHDSQKHLGLAERKTNLAGRIRVRSPLDGRRFLLIDDVVTTGSTLLEAGRAIRSAGGTVVAAATLAYTPRLDDRPVNFSL